MQKTIHHLRDCSEEYVSLCDMDLTVDDICLCTVSGSQACPKCWVAAL